MVRTNYNEMVGDSFLPPADGMEKRLSVFYFVKRIAMLNQQLDCLILFRYMFVPPQHSQLPNNEHLSVAIHFRYCDDVIVAKLTSQFQACLHNRTL